MKSFSSCRVARLLDVVKTESSIGSLSGRGAALQSIGVNPDIEGFGETCEEKGESAHKLVHTFVSIHRSCIIFLQMKQNGAHL